MLKTIYISVLLICAAYLQAQCTAQDCPITLPPSGTVSSHINLNGAINPVMGQNNQYLRAVSLQIQHDAIDELDIVLIAPNGSSLSLSTYQGIQIGQNITFDICFLACNETPRPDPGFPVVFESDAGYQQDGFYSGSYYPAVGCLNQLNGPLNGNWELRVKDNFIQDGGKLNGWSLEFADNSGLACISGCLPPLCAAAINQIGTLRDTLCTGDPALNFSISPTFPFSSPDPSIYDYMVIIVDKKTGVIIEYSEDPDLTTYPPGLYEIYGLLYEIGDLASIPDPNGSLTIINLRAEIQNNAFCAQPSNDHYTIQVKGAPETASLTFDPIACADDTAIYTIHNFDEAYQYDFLILKGEHEIVRSTDSSQSLIWTKGPGELLIRTYNECDTSETLALVDVIQTPEFNLSGQLSACVGDTASYIISPLPDSTYSYSFAIDGGKLINYKNDTVLILWEANNNVNSVCATLSGPHCSSNPNCMEVAVPDKSSVQIIPDADTLCQLSAGTSHVNSGFEVLSYKWSSSGLTFLSETDTDTVNYLVNADADSAMLCVTLETSCGQFGPFCKTITIFQLPEITNNTSINNCGQVFQLDADVQGADSLSWTQFSGPSPAVIDQATLAKSQVTVTAFGQYEFIIEAFTESCMTSDTIAVNALASPVTSNLSYECSLHAYSVSFDIHNGTPPYLVNGNIVSGNHFVSDYIPSGDNYLFEVTDNSGCSTQVSGTKDCPCASYAGTMDTTTLRLCAEVSPEAILLSNPDFIKDHNDTIMYIMYEDASDPWGSLIASSMFSKFSFQMGLMQYGETYFISRVVGNQLNGEIDLTDPCLSISNGQAVIFYDNPELNIEPIPFSCERSFNLQASISEDVQFLTWSRLSGPTSAVISNKDLPSTSVSVTSPGLYSFQLKATNEACSQFDTVDIEVLSKPVITLLDKDCQSPDSYILSVNIQGQGTTFTANIPGRINGNHFTSDPLPQDTSFILSVIDDKGCTGSIAIGPVDCSCKTEAGYTQFSEFTLCIEESLDPGILDIQGTYLEEEDSIEYILHTGKADSLGRIIQRSWGNPLHFDKDNMQTGQIYHLTVLAGDYGLNEVNLNDPCLDMIHGIEVLWNAQPVIKLDQAITLCVGDTASIPINSTGPYPLNFSLSSSQGRTWPVTLENNTHFIDIPVYYDQEVWYVDTVFNSCSVAFQGEIIISGETPKEIKFKSKPEICNDITDPALLDLDHLFLEDPSIKGEWSSEELIINGSLIEVEGRDSGQYTIYFKVGKVTDACPPQTFTLQLSVKDCECSTLTFPSEVRFCNSADKIDLQAYFGVDPEGRWTIENPEKHKNPPVLDGSILILSNATEGSYSILYDVEKESGPECRKKYSIELSIERQRSAGIQTSIPFYCIGEERRVDLMNLIENADFDGSWIYKNRQVNSTIYIDSFPHGIQEFEYRTKPSDVCVANKSIVRIEVNPMPEIVIKTEDVKCAGDKNGSIEIISDNDNDDYAPYTYVLDDSSYSENIITDLASGQYTLLARNRNGCSSNPSRISISAPLPLELDLGEDLVLQKAEEATIHADLNIPASQVEKIIWTRSGEVLDNINSLYLTLSVVNDALIEAIVFDENGCSISDQVNITIKEDNDIYLPNVFNPNSSDPENRKFGISYYEHISEISSFRIYDRWGNRIFARTNFLPGNVEGYWNGTAGGQMMPSGVYTYSIIYRTIDGKERALHGNITLLF